jgi:RNA polymerase sigma-70 factor (ECF subfamily)
MPTPSPDHELVQRLLAGDEPAYRGLIEHYQNRALRLAYRILRNREEAEEVAQVVFVKVFLSIKSFAGRSSLFAWIYRIAANESYSALRKRVLEVCFDAPDPHGASHEYLRTCQQTGPRWDLVVLQRNYLNRPLAALPERERHLLLLREVEGLSMTELAEATGLNENTVKVRLFRARQRLVPRGTPKTGQ